MNEVQSALLSMYKDIRRILDEHDIRFYVQFGTAIGVLRHDGFIPWDDDIDIVVWREDLPRINEVLTEGLDPTLYYYHIPSADNHPHVIALGDDPETSLRERRAPFIDIFPIDPIPGSGIRRRLADIAIWGNCGSIWAIDHIDNITLHRALGWIPGVFERLILWIGRDSGMTTIVSTDYADYVFPEEWYGEPVWHRFEDTEAPLPCEIDAMLTHMFGDYMTPPPEDKRVGAGGFPCGAYKDYRMGRNVRP